LLAHKRTVTVATSKRSATWVGVKYSSRRARAAGFGGSIRLAGSFGFGGLVALPEGRLALGFGMAIPPF
jgi:hypothetical protein